MATPVFLKTAARAADFPSDFGREVAFVGRSNSGKSTALNRIAGVRKLARVSKTPGRTQLVNFFAVAPERRLVDLPGYGFARVSPEVRDRWRGLLEGYLRARQCLVGLVLTVDIRRGLTALDGELLAWLAPRGLPIALLLTKADKLSRGAGLRRQAEVAARLGAAAEVIRFSATAGDGVAAARAWLDQRLGSVDDGNKEAPGAGFRGHTRGSDIPAG
jgi:GTP-binding protein